MMEMIDVLVVGGGTAGAIAATQAARTGAKTVLIEFGSILGGTITVGGVSYPGLFHAHGKQVIRGIGWDIIKEAVRLNNDHMQDFSKPPVRSHTENQIHINKDIFALLLEEECLKAGVKIRYYETVENVELIDDLWLVDIVGKGTRTAYRCNQLIDCTGNATLSKLAGFKCNRSKETQPGSLMFKLCGYTPENLDYELLQLKYDEALDKGIVKREEFFSNIRNFLTTAYYKNTINSFSNHMYNADSSTSVTHTTTNIYSRKALLNMLRFLRGLPGLEKTAISHMSPETAVRETFRIDAKHNITIDEYINGERYIDSVCHTFYPIDLHNKKGVSPQRIRFGVVPEVPLRSLIPKVSRNFIVAGRCIGSDQIANSALRVQATCMATGQVAGAAAAIASKNKVSPIEVPLEVLKKILIENNAIVPPKGL